MMTGGERNSCGRPHPGGLRSLLEEMVERGASDLHISAGARPRLRIDGELTDVHGVSALPPREVATLARSVLAPRQWEHLEEGREVDAAFDIAGLARFRCHCFRQRGHPAMALRSIALEIPRLEELELPSVLDRLVKRPRGLILVTGPTGSGKSTTLAAMLNRINESRRAHLLTIEDPVEFIHPSRRCTVSQREIGMDTESFASALRSAARQDPDVILVGEMRDSETVSAALTIAETGHLVLASMHTNSAAASIHRIIDATPAGQQEQIRAQLSMALEGVVTQVLLARGQGPGRVAACEVLVCTPAVRAAIRDHKVHQIPSMMQTGRKHGMQTMNDALRRLCLRRAVSLQVALKLASDPGELSRAVRGAGLR